MSAKFFERVGLNISWFPGHMATAARTIEQRLKVVDMVIEVRDARVPLSSTCGHLEQLIQKKRRIIVLNKSDLIGQTDTERWVRHFTQQGQAATFTSAVKGSRIGDLMPQELLKRGLLTRTDRILLFMIIGIPNTGKSTIINALRRSGMRASTVRPRGAAGADCKTAVAETGARPGVTRHVSTVQFSSNPSAFLMDTPGIMQTSMSTEHGLKLALTGAIKDSIVDMTTLAEYLLFALNKHGQVAYVKSFGLSGASDDINVVLLAVANTMRFKLKKQQARGGRGERGGSGRQEQQHEAEVGADEAGATGDLLRAAHYLIKLYRSGALGRFVLDDIAPS